MKTILIDGHNLIPHIPGLRLDDPEDESKLIQLLSEYCQHAHTRIELFFDGAPPGQSRTTKQGNIHIHFIRAGTTADNAIISYLRNSGKNVRNLTMVSSDRRVHVEAKSLHATVISSEFFSSELQKTLSSEQVIEEKRSRPLTGAEVEEWEKLFISKKG